MIRWANDPPPADGRRKLEILHAKHTQLIEVLVLSDREVGVFGHWNPELRRNSPCCDPDPCVCQREQVATWWRAYLAVWTGQKVAIAEIPSKGWCEAKAVRLRECRGSLRGLKLRLDRSPRVKTGAVVAVFSELAVPPDAKALPPAPCLRDELQRIWFSRL